MMPAWDIAGLEAATVTMTRDPRARKVRDWRHNDRPGRPWGEYLPWERWDTGGTRRRATMTRRQAARENRHIPDGHRWTEVHPDH